jgi:hypothetical protein
MSGRRADRAPGLDVLSGVSFTLSARGTQERATDTESRERRSLEPMSQCLPLGSFRDDLDGM